MCNENLLSNRSLKFYVFCPAGIVTGGAELLHQFCDVLNNNGYQAYIIYFGESRHEIPNAYQKYNIKLAESAEDSVTSIVVLFEGYFTPLSYLKNARVILWWLSVDNFYYCQWRNICFNDVRKFRISLWFKKILRLIVGRKAKYVFSLHQLASDKRVIFNAYQSEYAKDFLMKHNFPNVVSLKDYINDDFIYTEELSSEKADLVVYNPKKGFKFTKKLITRANDLNWVPISNMSREQVKETLKNAKLYIDFGYHPGKDRLPREAALCGCCVITGKEGSAGFYGDIPIDESKYKFSQHRRDIKKILVSIRSTLDNYEKAIMDFTDYRQRIALEKNEFTRDVLFLASSIEK